MRFYFYRIASFSAVGVPRGRSGKCAKTDSRVGNAKSKRGGRASRGRADFGSVGGAVTHMRVGGSCHRPKRGVKAGAVRCLIADRNAPAGRHRDAGIVGVIRLAVLLGMRIGRARQFQSSCKSAGARSTKTRNPGTADKLGIK